MPIEPKGIMINLISKEKLNDMSPEERIKFIVEEVKQGKVLILERGLTAVEEMELIKMTMANIDHDSFVGVETPGFSLSSKKRSFFDKLLGRKPPPRMMVVGPANLLKTIRKDGKVVQAMLLAKGGLRPMRPEEVEGTEQIKVDEGGGEKGGELLSDMQEKDTGRKDEEGEHSLPPPPTDIDGTTDKNGDNTIGKIAPKSDENNVDIEPDTNVTEDAGQVPTGNEAKEKTADAKEGFDEFELDMDEETEEEGNDKDED